MRKILFDSCGNYVSPDCSVLFAESDIICLSAGVGNENFNDSGEYDGIWTNVEE